MEEVWTEQGDVIGTVQIPEQGEALGVFSHRLIIEYSSDTDYHRLKKGDC